MSFPPNVTAAVTLCSDERGLYAFDSTGRFLNEIGRRGNGPEEYLYMDCYALDRRNKLVYVVCNVQKKIFRFTYQGKFHSVLHVDKCDANIASRADDGSRQPGLAATGQAAERR